MCADQPDVIDEALSLFKANIFFRNYEPQGAADRILIYVTLYISKCLSKIVGKSKGEADQILFAQAIENFSLPGEKTFPLGGFVTPPQNKADADFIRQYLTQLRQECGIRFTQIAYANTDQLKPNKWWACFAKRKFVSLSSPLHSFSSLSLLLLRFAHVAQLNMEL